MKISDLIESFQHYKVKHKPTGKTYKVTAMSQASAKTKAAVQHGGRSASKYSGTSDDQFEIVESLSETVAGAIASVSMPMGKMHRRQNPSVFSKKKKVSESNPKREQAVSILVALVNEKGLDNFENKDQIESFMSDNMPEFYRGRDTGKAIEDAMAELGLDEGKSPHKKGTKKYKAHMAAMHAGG